MIEPTAAIENLTNYQQQADMDGVLVTVSRQALEEVLDYLRTPPASQSDEALEPLGAEFEAVWDTNVDELYEFDIPRSDAGEEAGEPVASATPASGTDEALVEACAKAICEVGFEWYDSDIWREMWRKQARAILPIIKAREAAAHAAGRAEMRKEAVGYAKNLALEFEKGDAYDESVVATSLAEGICALGDKP